LGGVLGGKLGREEVVEMQEEWHMYLHFTFPPKEGPVEKVLNKTLSLIDQLKNVCHSY